MEPDCVAGFPQAVRLSALILRAISNEVFESPDDIVY